MSYVTSDQLSESITRIFQARNYDVRAESPLGDQTRVDLVAYKGDSPKFAFELKAGSTDQYLPYSAYSQAEHIKANLPDGAFSVVFTNMPVSGDLQGLFRTAGVPVAIVKDLRKETDILEALQKAMIGIGLQMPEELLPEKLKDSSPIRPVAAA
jgi:hypothetical protein